MNHEGRWLGIFQPDKEESAYLKKKTKDKAAKRGFSKSLSKSLEKKKLKVSPQEPTKEEGQLRTFWRETSKEGHSEKMRKGPATNIADTILVLVSRATNGGNQLHTKNLRNVL